MQNISGNTILITGGASGIGLAFAERFVAKGNDVIVCGRRKDQLDLAKSQVPKLHTIQADVATEAGRTQLAEQVLREFPKLNVLVNNAGVQNGQPLVIEKQDWKIHANEIAINLEAPMHLSFLFIPQLLKQSSSAIINVTSGLAFVPIAFAPTYCATKAALHSWTMSLRHQLKATSIKVIECAPPAVQTDLGGKGHHDFGAPLDAFADSAFSDLEKGKDEFGYGSAQTRLDMTAKLTEMFHEINAPKS